MAKQTGIYVENEGWMTVSAYAAMLEGQYQDAMNVLDEYSAKGEEWSHEAIQYASFALPDGPAFETEVLEAYHNGNISERSWLRLERIGDSVWKRFAEAVREATGKELAEFEADTSYFDAR